MRFWRKDILAASVAIPSAVSLIITLVAVSALGIEAFGIWLVGKSAVQLTANLTPGWSASLPLTMPDAGPRTKMALERRATRLTLGFGCLLGLALFTISAIVFQELLLIGVFSLYWTGIFFAAHSGLVARGRCDGRLIGRGAVVDTIGGLAVLGVTLSGSLIWFVAAQGFRAWAKGVALLSKVRLDSGSLPSQRLALPRRRIDRYLLQIGFPMVIRGWLQTATQYGDRLLLGLFFGPVVAGAAGLGSSLALPLAVVASATATWVIPLSSRGASGVRDKPSVARECFLMGILGIGLAMLIPVLSFFIPEVEVYLQLVLSGYVLLFGVSVSVLAGSFLISRRMLWATNGLGLFVIISMAFAMACVSFFGFNPAVSLVATAVLACFGSATVLSYGFEESAFRISAAVFSPLLLVIIFVLWVPDSMSITLALFLALGGVILVAIVGRSLLPRNNRPVMKTSQ